MTRTIIAALLLLPASVALAHHPAADIVDEEIYAHIDEMVADTPHADLTFDDMGGGAMDTTVTMDSTADLELLIADGLLDDVDDLSGQVDATITIDGGGVVLTVSQRP